MNEKRGYYKLFLLGVLALALTIVMVCLITLVFPDLWLDETHTVLATLPLLPAVLFIGYTLARAISLALREMDELQQRIQLEAYSFSLAGTVILALGLGLVQFFSRLYINLAFVSFMVAVFWSIGFLFAKRKYR